MSKTAITWMERSPGSYDKTIPGAATDPNQRIRYTYDEYKRVLTVHQSDG